MGKALIPCEEHGKIIELYNSGLSQAKVGELYDVSRYVIGDILKKYQIQTRDDSHKGRKYTINENYFDHIDTQNKAYILGLLYSDGCNYLPQHRVKLELQERDKSILDKINIEIGSNKPLSFNNLNAKNSNWQNTYRIDITNKHISEKLNSLGMVQNKSLILNFPIWLDESLYSHFLRGYFDGDGCLQKYYVSIASTKQFCEKVLDICDSILNIRATLHDVSHKPESNTKLVYICGISQMQIFLNYLYEDAELYIQRKYDAYKDVHYKDAI